MQFEKSSQESRKTSGIADCDKGRQALLSIALAAARVGRERLLHYLGRLKNIEKKYQAGLVTEADKAAEIAIFNFLKSATAELKFGSEDEFDFLGEESSSKDFPKITDGYRWIVDPLDGTTNYVHQFPFFGVSIGLEYKGERIIGVVDAPLLNEVFCAIKGGGAYANGRRLQISNTPLMEDAFIATGFHAEIDSVLEEQIRMFSRIAKKTRAVRRAGSAALDLCYVAKGVFDFYYERNLQPWDSAAGILIVEEAGGVSSSFRGKAGSAFSNSLVAGSEKLVMEFREQVKDLLAPETD